MPSADDRRQLGVQVDRITCRPSEGRAWPPRRALVATTLSAAIVAASLAWLALPLWAALAGTVLIAIVQAVALTQGPALYNPAYLDLLPRLAFWIATATIGIAAIAGQRLRRPLSTTATVALACSAGALFVELLALLHPSKDIVDAVFHAHRLQWVLGGRYYFTQPMPSGVQFPYAIALYVAAAPWAALTSDHVALLKIVVSVARAVAGLLLYPLIVRAWCRGEVAATAVVLFHFVPLPFVVIGNANLTYAFGQSMGVIALAVAASWTLAARSYLQLAGLTAIVAIALLSHVGLFPLIAAILLALAVLYWIYGGAPLRAPAGSVLLATILAVVLSVTTYYGWFWESYRTLARVRSQPVASVGETPAAATAVTTAMPDPRRRTAAARGVRAAALAVDAFGWPLLLLTAVGIWRVVVRGARDRLGLLLVASGAACVLFVGFSSLLPVEPAFERYADEFISRVYYAVMPAVAVLAAEGAVWAWRFGMASRVLGATLVGAAAIAATQAWLLWLV